MANSGTVLIVDDEPLNIDLLANLLDTEYELSCAFNGEDALRLAKELVPDLILLDVNMPGMSGYEVCRRLKQTADTRDIPVIFLTAQSDLNGEIQGLEIGAADYITKPFSEALLRKRIRNHIELARLRARQTTE